MTDAPTGTVPPAGAGDGRGPAEGERSAATGPTSVTGSATGEWPRKAADAIDLAVDTIHDKAIRPVLLAARAVVFGVLVAALALAVVVLLSVGLVRLLDVYVVGGRVWISYAVLGGIFTVAGLTAWSRRTAGSTAGQGR
jgi:hypothetical protein